MPLTANGLVKLIEECGELQQIAAKKLNYFSTDDHPDGKGSMATRLKDEIADTYAAMMVVSELFNLNQDDIRERAKIKRELFPKWYHDE